LRTTVRQIEHIIVKVKYPAELFQFLTETLDLPVSWPLKTVGGLVTSGGVFLGNINLEVLHAGLFFRLIGAIPRKEGIVGIAFDPWGSLENIVNELDEIGIAHSVLKPFELKGRGTRKTLWTSLNLVNILPGHQIFYRKFSEEIDERRLKPINEFKKRKGGNLGIDYVKEIVIGYKNESVMEEWKKLLICENVGEQYYANLRLGPGIRFVKHNNNSILSMLIKVKSLENVREFLIKNDLAGTISDNEINIKTEKVQGLEIRLCEL